MEMRRRKSNRKLYALIAVNFTHHTMNAFSWLREFNNRSKYRKPINKRDFIIVKWKICY